MEVYPDKPNLHTLLKDLLCTLGMYDVWLFHKLAIQTTLYILFNRDYMIILYKTSKDG